MLLDDLAVTSDAVAATRSRLAKVEALAELLKRMEPDEIAPALGLLLGKPRQGRIGVGWRGLAAAAGEPAAEPTLTIAEVDETLDTLAAASGQGSNQARASALRELRRPRDRAGAGVPAAERCSARCAPARSRAW